MPTPTDVYSDAMKEFDPNNPRMGKNFMWATFKPQRRGSSKFKMHMGRGPALNACSLEGWYVLYVWDREVSRWIEVTRLEGRHTHKVCFNCKKDVTTNPNTSHHRLIWMFVGLPTLREIGLCAPCRNANNGRFAQMARGPVDKRFFAQTAR